MSNALLITFYFPPAGGPGVHRWLRFSKFFKENNWNLTVYCPENAAWPVVDKELEHEIPSDIKIIRRPIFEPQKYIQKKAGFEGGAGIGSQKKKGLITKLLIWARGNLFIPDARRFWINPSYRFLKHYLKENPSITHIISTGPPHSMHLIARKLKHSFPHLKWVADFRDPWTEIDYYQELLPGKYADKRQKALELAVLKEADLVVSIGEDSAQGLARIGQRKVEIITNGFIFPEFDADKQVLDKRFSIAHFGSMAASRNPEILWLALSELVKELPALAAHLEINLYGSVDFSVLESIEKNGLSAYFSGTKNVTHAQSISLQRSTQLLLLVANKSINSKGILTGKFFEYLGAKRPMIVIGAKKSDLEQIVQHTNAGYFVGYEELEQMKTYLKEAFEQYLNNELTSNATNTEAFHSRVLLKNYLQLMEQLS